MEFGITGPSFTVSTACSSSNHAIGQALWMVRNGVADRAVCGGCEAIFCFGFLKAWEAMRVVSPDTCRPFSRDRGGIILGEGAAMFVIELLEEAQARGARIYAELAGFGMSSDAHHITQPSPVGAAAARRMALSDAGLAAEQIGYVNAHGTGTAANDSTESAALGEVLPAGPLVSSTKSMHGHAMGASASLEAAATALALHQGVLPPTANFREPDPQCPVNLITAATPRKVEAALSNSFAFGGLNAVLAFRSV
jgi:nodulation protein E